MYFQQHAQECPNHCLVIIPTFFFSFFAHIDGTAIWVTSLEPVLCGHVSEVEYRGIISASAPSEKQPVVPVSPGSKRERVKEC